MSKGWFISFEGGEGAGKSSLIVRLEQELRNRGMETVVTREPGGIEIAERIRAVILDKQHTAMDGRTEALLYAAARRQHLVEKVIPAIEQGKIVLCDRFIDSSLAYQGYARGLGIDEVMSINAFAIDGMMPDMTIYLDLDPELGLQRIRANEDREVNRLDLEAIGFHKKVREGYRILAQRYPERIFKVDAAPEQQAVFATVLALIERQFAKKRLK